MTKNRKLIVTGVFVCFFAATAMAQRPDVEGSKDHPLITRYPGSALRFYDQKEYEEFELPLGKGKSANSATVETLEKHLHLEGKLTRLGYETPQGRSTLEVFRNYQGALAGAGFVTLFECKGFTQGPGGCGIMSDFVTMGQFGQGSTGHNADERYLAAKLARPQGDVYAELEVYPGVVLLAVVEMKPMEAGLVTVNAEALAGDISRTGHVAVYGIYFDTGKSDVKPQSDAALKEIAKLLEQDPKLKLYVVGHTDNVGTLASNMDLSRRRANAVVLVLTTKYGVAAARLNAQGDGPTAPVVSNKDEDGRAKNRRVELVEQ